MTLSMPTGSWIGDLRGTIMANLFAEFAQDAEGVKMTLRVNSQGTIVVLAGSYEVTGDSTATARLVGQSSPPPDWLSGITASINFTSIDQQRLHGRWELPDGNAGALTLVPVVNEQKATAASETRPIQVIQRTRQLPKIIMFRDEIKDLIEGMKSWLPTPLDVVMRADIDGKEIRRFAPDFWDVPNLPRETRQLNLWLSEPGDGQARSININLSPIDCSYTVTGTEDVWVSGTFHEIDQTLARKHGWWRWFYEKHALNFNGVALLLALALLPSLELPARLVLLGSTVALALVIKVLHDRTTALRVFLRADFKETQYLDLPRLLTALASAGLIAFVGWAYGLLSSGQLGPWLGSLLGVP